MNKLYSIVVAFLMFFNLSLFAQDGPPWDFNGTDHGFVAQNYTSITVGDTYLTLKNQKKRNQASTPLLKKRY